MNYDNGVEAHAPLCKNTSENYYRHAEEYLLCYRGAMSECECEGWEKDEKYQKEINVLMNDTSLLFINNSV